MPGGTMPISTVATRCSVTVWRLDDAWDEVGLTLAVNAIETLSSLAFSSGVIYGHDLYFA